MEAFLTFPGNALPYDVTLQGLPQLRGSIQASENLQGLGALSQVSAGWQLSLGVAVGVLTLVGTQQQRRRRCRSSLVKCHAVPSKEEVANAKKEADLIAWAAKATAGTPQEAAMVAKAQAKTAAYQALKAAFDQGVAAAPVPAYVPPVSMPQAAAPVAAAGVADICAGNSPTKDEVEAAKKKADLLVWAAKKLESDGSPQAAQMKAKADAKLNIYQSLKEAFESGSAPAPVAAAPFAAAPVAAAAPVSIASHSGAAPSKQEVEEAKKKSDLITWAANKLAEKGDPQAAGMQARAARKFQEYEALKVAYEGGCAVQMSPAAVAAPAAAAAAPISMPVASAPPAGAVSAQELAEFKKDVDLMVWCAKTLARDGSPQAADMQAKAQAKQATYESLKAAAMA